MLFYPSIGDVIARLDRAIQYSASLVVRTNQRHEVLDAPLEAGHDSRGASLRGSLLHPFRLALLAERGHALLPIRRLEHAPAPLLHLAKRIAEWTRLGGAANQLLGFADRDRGAEVDHIDLFL